MNNQHQDRLKSSVAYNKIVFIVNPMSNRGRARHTFETVCQPIIDVELKGRNVVVYFTNSKEDTTTKTNKAIEEDHADLIVACGGDGTNHDVLNAIAKMYDLKSGNISEVAMACLPMGSGNDFAKTVGFTTKENKYKNIYEHMIHYIATGATVSMDLGFLTSTDDANRNLGQEKEKYFLNIASFGVSSAVIDSFNTGRIWINKDFTISMLSIWQQFVYKNKQVQIEWTSKEGKTHSETFLQQMTAVCNGQFFGSGLNVGPKASIKSGEFHLCTLGDVGFWDISKILPALYSGTHGQYSKVTFRDGVKVVAKPAKPEDRIVIEADGELCGILPATFTSLPAAINFVVNEAFLVRC